MPDRTPPHNFLRAVFSPIQIGALKVKNRVLMSGMHMGFEKATDPYGRLADFFEIRAKGDVGIIIVGGCSPDPAGRVIYTGGLCISTDVLISEHQRLVKAIKKHGSVAVLQLCPFGREAFHGRLVAPSALRLSTNIYTPKSLTDAEIEESIDGFSQAILRASKAGYDAVEIVASQGFLIHQFLAKRTNIREDRWGGSIENRTRYLLEVIRRSRSLMGNDYPLIIRLPSLDLIEGGLSYAEFQAVLDFVVAEKPAVINVSIGWHESPVPTIAVSVPAAAFATVANLVRSKSNGIPIAVSNRIHDLRIAEKILRAGMADIVAMARPFLADPFIVKKSKASQWDAINTCVSCNQECLDNAFKGNQIGCIVNPQCAELDEERFTKLPAGKRKRFIVVGGGLAGMSAALWLARFGHEVTLYEKSSILGGQINLATKIPGKQIFAEPLRYYEHHLCAEKVTIVRGHAWKVSDCNLDGVHVIVATGAIPRKPAVMVDKNVNYYSYDELLREKLPLIFPVVILGSGAISLDLASYIVNEQTWLDRSLAFFGPHIESHHLQEIQNSLNIQSSLTIISRSRKLPGSSIGASTRWINFEKVHQNTTFLKQMQAIAITTTGVHVEHLWNKEKQVIPAKTVIYAVGQESESSLLQDLKARGISHTVIGLNQCTVSRYNAGDAVKQGYACAKRLSF